MDLILYIVLPAALISTTSALQKCGRWRFGVDHDLGVDLGLASQTEHQALLASLLGAMFAMHGAPGRTTSNKDATNGAPGIKIQA